MLGDEERGKIPVLRFANEKFESLYKISIDACFGLRR